MNLEEKRAMKAACVHAAATLIAARDSGRVRSTWRSASNWRHYSTSASLQATGGSPRNTQSQTNTLLSRSRRVGERARQDQAPVQSGASAEIVITEGGHVNEVDSLTVTVAARSGRRPGIPARALRKISTPSSRTGPPVQTFLSRREAGSRLRAAPAPARKRRKPKLADRYPIRSPGPSWLWAPRVVPGVAAPHHSIVPH